LHKSVSDSSVNHVSLQQKTVETEFKITSDGSLTLYVPEIDETYHSTHGAIQESAFIFIDKAFRLCTKNEIKILEIGFGTGLNSLLTAAEAEKSEQKVTYISLEKFPVAHEKAQQLNYYQQVKWNHATEVFQSIHRSPWEKEVEITSHFRLKKVQCDFTTYLPDSMFDLVYFDAFSPEKQPEMWTEQQFQKIYNACNSGAILTTYCAKGKVRRALQTVGFEVERLAGPPGKREILRAVKN